MRCAAPWALMAAACLRVPPAVWPAKTHYRTVEACGKEVAYREAGDPSLPTILLLHGFPSSSHTYRELIPLLSGRFHVVAPDALGSGSSAPPDAPVTFDQLAAQQVCFVETLGLDAYVLYLQDFGGPVGLRLAMALPERVRGLVVQNANAYLDGLTPQRQAFFRGAHDDRSPEGVAALRRHLDHDGIVQRQYLRDVAGRTELIAPDAWAHDLAVLDRPGAREVQLQLFQDYASNLDAYPAWQAWLRRHQPPTLVVWGARDAAFGPDGARAYARDLPHARIVLLDAGHFAVEEQPVRVAQEVTRFLQSAPVRAAFRTPPDGGLTPPAR